MLLCSFAVRLFFSLCLGFAPMFTISILKSIDKMLSCTSSTAACCMPNPREICNSSNWLMKVDQKRNSSVGEAFYRNLQPEYRYRRPGFESREVIGWSRRWTWHTPILFQGIVVGYFFAVLLVLELQRFTDCQVFYTTNQICRFKIDLFDELIGVLAVSSKECQWLRQSISTGLRTRWTHWDSYPPLCRPLQLQFLAVWTSPEEPEASLYRAAS